MPSFDLTTLDGVTFGIHSFSVDGGGNINSGSSIGPEIGGPTVSGQTTVNVYYIDGLMIPSSDWTISNAANDYVAGHYNSSTHFYYLPTFGSFTLSTAGTVTAYNNETWYVHGFSSGALLLSSSENLAVYSHGSRLQAYKSSIGETDLAVLSNTDLGAGPTSPAYNASYYDKIGIYHAAGSGPNDGNATPPTFPLVFTTDSSQYTVPCFAEGSRVKTPSGEVAVEDLAVGDEVVTATGEARPVIWIGSRRVKPESHPRPWEVNPVRVRAHAFGQGLPAHDLRLSPGHAVYVEGVLVPAGLLVNGATIVQEAVEQVRYFHVELDAHDVLLAEGLACESYLDDGNREAFVNGAKHTALWGRLDPEDREHACAPVVCAGDPRLAAIQAGLHARAEQMGWIKTEDAGLELVVDGQSFAPVHRSGQRLWFILPAAAEVEARSNAGRLCDVVPGCADGRRLGVAIGELRIDGQPLDLACDAFGQGFHGLEGDGTCAWRWTDGAARLALDLQAQSIVELRLHMTAPTWTRPAGAWLRLINVG